MMLANELVLIDDVCGYLDPQIHVKNKFAA
jgi:hypothetical protein